MDIELITVTLAANAVARIERAGRYIEVIDAQYTIASITLTDDAGGQAAFIRNCLSGIYAEIGFRAFDVVNGASAQTITVMVCTGRGGSRRQPGVVQVVDSSKARVLSNQSFMDFGFASSTAALAAQVQAWNPAGSGKRLIVQKVVVNMSVAGLLNISPSNAALTTLRGQLSSKLGGGASAASQVRTDQAAVPGTSAKQAFGVSANTPINVLFADPVVLPPGYGLTVWNDVGPVGLLSASFETIEEAV
ncbi:hypothetical protein [Piscinibacter sp.]|uniref:hypothetical protein n=1 Tax=Piscinibacter sp. TaxID=1903157 RepID=UPI0039E4FC97